MQSGAFAATDSAVHGMFGATGIIGDVSIAPENLVFGQHAVRQRAFGRAGRSPARFDAKEHTAQHAADVGIDHGDSFAERKAQHRGGGVIADAGQCSEFVIRTRQFVGVLLGHHAGTFLQAQCTAWIAEPTPCGDHLGLGGLGE